MSKIKVLFICHGNICRSPIAEFVMKDMVTKRGIKAKFYIASAATSTEEIWNGIGNPVYPPAKRELAKHGISCEGKRAVQITKACLLYTSTYPHLSSDPSFEGRWNLGDKRKEDIGDG